MATVPGDRWEAERQKGTGDQGEPSKSCLRDLLPPDSLYLLKFLEPRKTAHQLGTKGSMYVLVCDISYAKYSLPYKQNHESDFKVIQFNCR